MADIRESRSQRLRRKNYSRQQPPITVADGDVIEQSNLSQQHPGTVLEGFRHRRLTFRRCNLVNIEIDPAWTVEDCNVSQREIPPPPTEAELKAEEIESMRDEVADLQTRIAEMETSDDDNSRLLR